MKNYIKEHKYGIIGTILFHVLILIVLIFMGFTTPLPLPGEEGIILNFGTDDSGSGLIEPESSENNTNEISNEKEQENNETSSSNNENILTQNYEESINIKSNNKTITNNTEETNTEQVEKQQEVNKKALFPGNNNTNNNSNSDGNKTGTGNQGDINGSPDSRNYNGNPGNGHDGISFSLNGRSTKALPKPIYNSQEEGKVVVDVTVDKLGNVLKAIPGVKGTTTADKKLWDAAKKAALEAKFTAKTDAPEEQKGTITYHFILQ